MQNRQTKQFAYVGPDARGEREMIEAWAEHEKEWEIFGAGTADVFRYALFKTALILVTVIEEMVELRIQNTRIATGASAL